MNHPVQPITERRRVRLTARQTVRATPDRVFPLLCPVREHDWIPEWDCRMVYSDSGLAEFACVFQTEREADGGVDTWVVSRYEPNSRIAFIRVNALRTIAYDIRLEATPDGSTVLEWTQVITALDEAGDRHVAEVKAEDFTAQVAAMEGLLNQYLAGEPLATVGH